MDLTDLGSWSSYLLPSLMWLWCSLSLNTVVEIFLDGFHYASHFASTSRTYYFHNCWRLHQCPFLQGTDQVPSEISPDPSCLTLHLHPQKTWQWLATGPCVHPSSPASQLGYTSFSCLFFILMSGQPLATPAGSLGYPGLVLLVMHSCWSVLEVSAAYASK